MQNQDEFDSQKSVFSKNFKICQTQDHSPDLLVRSAFQKAMEPLQDVSDSHSKTEDYFRDD